jgi:hypothetical protein
MKKQISFLIFQLCTIFLVAQSFLVDFPQVVDTTTGTGQNILFVGTITNNLCCDSLEIQMSITPLEELPSNWELEICTPSGCSNSEQIFTLDAAQTDSISVDFFTGIHDLENVKAKVKFLVVGDTSEQYEIDLMVNYVPDIVGTTELVMEKGILFQNFPNPFSDYTTIRYRLSSPAGTILITDHLGRIVKKIFLSNRSGEIVLGEGFEPGIYFYSLFHENEFITTKRFFVQTR